MVAAFVLVVGGFAVLRFSNTQFVKKYPNSASSQSADASGLDGLRGTTYKGLYNYINSNSKNIEDFIVDNSYIFKNIDALSVDDDDYVALYKQALRDHQLTPNPAGIQLTRSGVDITPTTSIDELETNITYGNAISLLTMAVSTFILPKTEISQSQNRISLRKPSLKKVLSTLPNTNSTAVSSHQALLQCIWIITSFTLSSTLSYP